MSFSTFFFKWEFNHLSILSEQDSDFSPLNDGDQDANPPSPPYSETVQCETILVSYLIFVVKQ